MKRLDKLVKIAGRLLNFDLLSQKPVLGRERDQLISE